MLRATKMQFDRQSESACRALKLEVEANVEAISEMIQDRNNGFPFGHADPGWLKHAIWDFQLPYIVQTLDPLTLADLQSAYSTLEAVPTMRTQTEQGVDIGYMRGGWVEAHLDKMRAEFDQAENSLRDRLNQIDSERWTFPSARLCLQSAARHP